jgi:type I site-specific restriction endonuclease
VGVADGDGPSDYVLFIGLMPVATIEAKNIDVSGALGQAKRYGRRFDLEAGMKWGDFQLPFTFSSPLQSFRTKSRLHNKRFMTILFRHRGKSALSAGGSMYVANE